MTFLRRAKTLTKIGIELLIVLLVCLLSIPIPPAQAKPDASEPMAEHFVAAPEADEVVSIEISPAILNVTAGEETFTVEVGIQTDVPINAAQAYINFDSSRIQVNNMSQGNLGGLALQNNFNNTLGQINYAEVSFTDRPAGTYTLLQVEFEAVGPSGNTPLLFERTDAARVTDIAANGSSVLTEYTDGNGTTYVKYFDVTGTPSSLDVCISDDGSYTTTVSAIGGFNKPVTLSTSGAPAGVTLNFSPNPVTPTGDSTLTISNTGAATAGSYNMALIGTAGALVFSTTVQLNLLESTSATWSGAVNGDWNTASNWSSGHVPDSCTAVTIPASAQIQLSANASAKSLTISHNATLNLKTFDLTVEESVTNNGIMEQTKDVPDGATTPILHIKNQAGTETKYYGVEITPDGGSALGATFVRIRGNQDCTTPAESMPQRCFNIEPTNSNSATIRYWLLPSELNSQNLTSLRLWDWNGGTWRAVGDSRSYGSDETCSTGAANCWYQYSNIASFSPHVSALNQPANPPVPPLAVQFANFAATPQDDHILVRWETVFELNHLGFNLYRHTTDTPPESPLNDELIPSQASGSGQGFSYSYEDYEVTEGVTSYYWLEDVDINGVRTLHGPVTATADSPTAVTLNRLESDLSALSWEWGIAFLGMTLAGVWLIRRRWLV